MEIFDREKMEKRKEECYRERRRMRTVRKMQKPLIGSREARFVNGEMYRQEATV